ncbi:hypothetical protein ACWGA0_19175 [Streptomyces erythrochromogenes]
MCLGDVRFEVFDRAGGRLAAVVLHHGATLRWGHWEGDAVLADGRLLLAWLDGHGMPGPLLEFEADRLRAQRSADAERDWLTAMPAGLEGTADRVLGLSRTGGGPSPELLTELTDRLQLAFPEPVERALALLDRYGSGSGRCSGYPSTRACRANCSPGCRSPAWSPTSSPPWPTRGPRTGTTPGPYGTWWAGRPARTRSGM